MRLALKGLVSRKVMYIEIVLADVRSYDCNECGIHFDAEISGGDAHEFEPDCPDCGDPTGFNCQPCAGDLRNDSRFPAVVGSAANPQLSLLEGCLFPNNKHHEVVSLKRD